MNPSASFRHIQIASVDLDDLRFMLAPREEPPGETLISSIREFGLLNPPLVLETGPDHFTVVSGRKRIRALARIGTAEQIPCLVLPAETPELSTYACLLEYVQVHSPLSAAEQIILLAKLSVICPPKNILPFLEKLGHKANQHKLGELLQLQQLTPQALQCLHDGILKYGNARKMLALAKTDQSLLVDCIRRLHLGGSKQQQLIELCSELIMRRTSDLKTILENSPVKITGEQLDNVPQQSAALLKWLHGECSPQLSAEESRFNKRAAQLNLPPGMQVSHTPAFEDDSLTLSIRFPDWDGLELALKKIGRDHS